VKILLTGASGFLGRYVVNEFKKIGHEIYALGKKDSDINVNIETEFSLRKYNIDYVIHIAGKAHIFPRSQSDIRSFWDVNVKGTQNLLRSLEENPPKRIVFISTVAVYGKTYGVLLDENTPVLALDPYGQSKIQAEANILDWSFRHNVICTILRLPLVYGENPPGNLNSMIQGIKKGYYFNISGGHTRKSMVRADDVARFILPASEVGGIYHLTDGYHPSFKEISHIIGASIGRKSIPNLPLWIAKIIAKIGDFLGPKFPFNSDKLKKITSELTFDDSLARANFGWNPKPVFMDDYLK
jgi:nucleoside-diphosphate-sugar epimerase